MEESKKYSLVCYLEGEHQNKIRAIQEKLFELTGSRKCLDAWTPHITLGSGIIVPAEQQETLDSALEVLANEHSSFDLTLHGFGGTTDWKGSAPGTATPFVLWINPETNGMLFELFNEIALRLTSNYETFYPRIVEYVPHVTVAYGDLTKEGYEIGEEYLHTLQFKDVIKISHIALVENLPDIDIEYKRFYFRD